MFRILSFTVHKHPFLGGLTFELTNREELATENYYSVIIGPNGTGKSNLLSLIIEAFNTIKLLKIGALIRPKLLFSMLYSLRGKNYKISTINGELTLKINDIWAESSLIELPEKWIASSVTIYDKYPILNNVRQKQIPEYRYLGIRSASNNAFVGRIKIQSVLHLVEALKNDKNEKLTTVYESLGLKPEMEIEFSGGIMLNFRKKAGKFEIYDKASDLIEPHKLFIDNNLSNINYRVDNYKRHLDDTNKIHAVYEFIQKNQISFQGTKKSDIQLKYKFNLSDRTGLFYLLDDWEILSVMLDLELIKINRFIITKDSSKFNYEEASSGENHLLSSFHGIVATLEDNSLLIIDEPEVSLHPNWQIDYLEILKSLIDNHSGVNVVIATHSHFLVSSLKNEESRILSIKRDKEFGKIEIEELDTETFGWDPESILYNIFEVATIRNKYFETDLRKLISYISTKSNDTAEIERLKDKIGKYVMPNEDDPLRLVIKQVENYLNNKNGLS